MRIALTHDNGEIFGHFGHTEEFKIYDIEDGSVVAAEVVPTEGAGHSALAGFLEDNDVDVLICGGIGSGAQIALADADIELYAGVTGSCDDAVREYLAGTLEQNNAANCNHHEHHHEHGEGCSCGCHGHHDHGHDHEHEHHHHDHDHGDGCSCGCH